MEEWKVVGVAIEGQPIDLEGLNPWKREWRETQEDAIELPHPSYPTQRHRMRVYKMEGAGKFVKFAAGELSANVWGFYLPS